MSLDSLAGLNQRIETAIPLSRAAGIRLETNDQDMLTAHTPFTGNSNPHDTASGGSLYVDGLEGGGAQTAWLLESAVLDATVIIRQAQAERS